MHILQIYKEYPPVMGGIENHVRDLSEGLVARGHYLTVLVTSRNRQTTIEQPHKRLKIIKAAREIHAASTPLSTTMLRMARRLHVDVAHLHFPYPPGDLVYHMLPDQPPLVVTYHSDVIRQRTMLQLYRPLLEQTLRQAARIIVTSPNYIASSPFLSRHATKCEVVPLGIDPARFADADAAQVAELRARHSPDGMPLLLFVGRLRYYKGLHVLLDALPRVRARLLVAGSGPEHDRLVAQAERLELADRVCFLGDVPDDALPALYHAADVFVLPAHLRSEAFGIVQLEALASGLPCVSTELGTGTSFVNKQGETGIVVPPNDPAALARALNILVANPALRQHFGENGRRRVADIFDRERMVWHVEQIYRAVLKQSA
ncbi:MAG TPA: glycosyltransferase [Roseiflexaceae bacterium]|jgi:rhamnosyl/mannosyltransferase|nr:glycosyltransferase [Roseiflexaceae bacterium]